MNIHFEKIIRIFSGLGEASALEHPAIDTVAKTLSIPAILAKLTVITEDKRFFLHSGVDPIAIARALTMKAYARGSLQGGSTIPEQLAKCRGISNNRSLPSRLLRAFCGLWYSLKSPKVDLLIEYLSTVYFGKGSFGIHSAAAMYFAKDTRELTPEESFFLVERIALPEIFRLPRVVNILSRPIVQLLLAKRIVHIPEAYGRIFGEETKHQLSEKLLTIGVINAK